MKRPDHLIVLPVLALTCFVFINCESITSPSSPGVQPYLGEWSGPGVSLVLTEDSLEYSKKGGMFGNKHVSGSFSGLDQNGNIAYPRGTTSSFNKLEVDEPPHEENGVWKMTVEGVELTRM